MSAPARTGPAESPAAAKPAEGRQPLHVLHIYSRFHPDYTGDGIYYTRLLPRIAEAGITGEFLAYMTEAPGPGATHEHAGQRVTYLPATGLPVSQFGMMRWLARNIRRFDVVHLHSHVDRLFLTTLLARLAGRPVIYSCTLNDSPTELANWYSPRYRRLVLRLLRLISAFVVISPHLLRRSLETTPAAKLRFIPQGIALRAAGPDPAERAAERARLGFAPDDFLLLNVGSISRRKNPLFLIEALALIPDPKVRLVLVGPALEADHAAEIEARIAELGLGERVVLAGFQEDTKAYYTAADVFVFASFAEGFPNVFLEAMDAALPTVTRFLPGLSDFVFEHGTSGLLADSEADFAAAIQRLRDEPALRLAMGARSRRFAERNLDIGLVARSYAALYRDLVAPRAAAAPPATQFGDFGNRFTAAVRPGPAAIGLREFDTPKLAPPLLQVVIDVESEFDWAKGIWTDTGRVSSIVALRDRVEVFRRHGVRPTLVVDHPIIATPESAAIVQALAAEGSEVGVHLHAWNTPPIVGPKDDWHSFSGNIGPALERLKIEWLTKRIEARLGRRPTIFKAGRYGLGPNTVEALVELGFEIDLSVCPTYDFSAMGGPDFTHYSARPGWFGAPGGLLSLPTTAGWLGAAAPWGEWLAPKLHGPLGRRLGLPRLAARANALYPERLSPEGTDLATLKRLTQQLHRQGLRVFTLSFHSPTLQVGHTPYTTSEADLARLLAVIDGYLAFFRDEMGGRFSTPSEIRAALLGAPAAARAAE
jgi:glycosyltransferase involved in cell wall biosynthesis/peptidoglycan/xylan/chitin deacetylase (PgdA/CDA1 family)